MQHHGHSRHCHRPFCAAIPGAGCRAHFAIRPQCRFGNFTAFPWRWKSHGGRRCAGKGHAGFFSVDGSFLPHCGVPQAPSRVEDSTSRNPDGGGGLVTCLWLCIRHSRSRYLISPQKCDSSRQHHNNVFAGVRCLASGFFTLLVAPVQNLERPWYILLHLGPDGVVVRVLQLSVRGVSFIPQYGPRHPN